MSNPRLFYWAAGGEDAETYFGGLPSEDATLQDARDKLDHFEIEDIETIVFVSARRADVRFAIFNAEYVIETLENRNPDATSEDGNLVNNTPTSEQRGELEDMLAGALRAWAAKYTLCTAYMLADMEDISTISGSELRATRQVTPEAASC